MGLRYIALKILGASDILDYETKITTLVAEVSEKDSHINTLEGMIKTIQENHIQEMKGINNKLDFVVEAYKKQKEEMEVITKELLWQREEALVWRERLEAKLELDANRLSPPQALIEIEKEIERRKDVKTRSKKA